MTPLETAESILPCKCVSRGRDYCTHSGRCPRHFAAAVAAALRQVEKEAWLAAREIADAQMNTAAQMIVDAKGDDDYDAANEYVERQFGAEQIRDAIDARIAELEKEAANGR